MAIRDTARALREGRTRSRALVEACLEQIHTWQPATNAFIHLDEQAARREADAADKALRQGHDRGLLHGIPISLKDLLDQQGVVTTAGSRSMTAVAQADAPCVAHLRAQGVVFLGRTNMHEFALGTTSEDSGFGPVRHPRDGGRSAGGSSGGAAVAVATGMSHVAIGSDTGGSIRIPAAACGLVGLKPSWGEVSLQGVVPLSPTVDCVGPLATSVDDAWIALQGLKTSATLAALPEARPVRGLRIGVLRDFGWRVVDPGIGRRVAEAIARLTAAGAASEDVPLASAPLVVPTYGTIVISEALDFHRPRLPVHAQDYTPAVRGRLETAARPSDEERARAHEARARIEADVADLLTRVDVLALPGSAITPPRLGQADVHWPHGDEPTRAAMLRLTQPFNLSRSPALVMPAGEVDGGWMASLQLVGRDTASLVAIARTVEAVLANGGA
ncbi:amidase [Luteitalea sp. TBR-22]|uniref:amidase n=1 Tax=Luteitalea sp. TBR-22 TaxID=2802971 RepID=UPI001AF70DB9|nr:amidase [Luteitalea sp. TBR-22]BCS35461.1 amidase [Luteitalea sp. TBR-22]